MTERKIPKSTKYEKQAAQWLKSMRTTAWYSYVKSSGIDLNTIRLRPRENSKLVGKDVYRRWNHWKKGLGNVELDDLLATEKKVPGSRVIYEQGPESEYFWDVLGPNYDSNIFLKSILFPKANIIPKRLKNEYWPLWVEVLHDILAYRELIGDIPKQNPERRKSDESKTGLAKIEDNPKVKLINTKNQLNKELVKIAPALKKYGLFPQDIFYYLRTIAKNNEELVEFNTRSHNRYWNNVTL